jgi:hypothetical protein
MPLHSGDAVYIEKIEPRVQEKIALAMSRSPLRKVQSAATVRRAL